MMDQASFSRVALAFLLFGQRPSPLTAIKKQSAAAPRYKLHIDNLLLNQSICGGDRPRGRKESIPKLLFQMFWQTFDLPPKIAANRLKYAPDYEHHVYDNYKFSDLIRTYFTKEVHTEVMKLSGSHRADVFRYAAMYLFGGVYLDIKTEMVMPLRWIFWRNGTTYTSLGMITSSDSIPPMSISQGILASPPCNPIFLHLMRKFVVAGKPILNRRYGMSLTQFYTLVAAMVGTTALRPQFYPNKFSIDAVNASFQQQGGQGDNGIGIGAVRGQQRGHAMDLLWHERDRPPALSDFNYELFVELNEPSDACWDGPDRYTMCSFVHANKTSRADARGKCSGIPCAGTERVFKTRYADYPSPAAGWNTTFKDTI